MFNTQAARLLACGPLTKGRPAEPILDVRQPSRRFATTATPGPRNEELARTLADVPGGPTALVAF